MLIQFNFKNFKSFRDEVSLDLTATKITEHEDHVAEAANDKLLKVALGTTTMKMFSKKRKH